MCVCVCVFETNVHLDIEPSFSNKREFTMLFFLV